MEIMPHNLQVPDAHFMIGERILAIDDRRRSYLIELRIGGALSTHRGSISHDEIVDQLPGVKVISSKGTQFRVIRPTVAEWIEAMPRGAQVIYPKDLAQILMMADIRPGVNVLESGVGSGALSTALLNAGAHVTGYEIREDFANRARNNVSAILGSGALEKYQIVMSDIYEGVSETGFDRVVLDLPEPWRVLPVIDDSLRIGGLIVAYQTSVGQLAQFRAGLEQNGFFLANTKEVLVRDWYYSSMALRPDQRMVAHTGFLTVARKGSRANNRDTYRSDRLENDNVNVNPVVQDC